MSLPAAVTLRRQGAPDLLVAYADALTALPLNPDARRIRRNAAARLLAAHPQLAAWMERPACARVADLKRTGAWPFLTWCFVEGHLVPDLDLLLAKTPGDLYRQWGIRHPGDVRRVAEVAQRFGWSANWARDVPAARCEACPYANICEQCDNYATAPEFIPQLQAQLADITALRDNAAQRGWHTSANTSRPAPQIKPTLPRPPDPRRTYGVTHLACYLTCC